MVEERIAALCTSPRAIIGVLVLVFLIAGILLHIFNYFVSKGKGKEVKKPLLWTAGTAFLVLAVLGLVIYVVIGPSMPVICPDLAPYCGDYCQNSTIPKVSENCTCLQY
jgi:uncharacterized membrane-anchored protein